MPFESQKIGPFKLLRKLDENGAFGERWIAFKDNGFLRFEVLIEIPGDYMSLSAIEERAGIWMSVSEHPKIISLIDADIHNGQVILVSKMTNAVSLRELKSGYRIGDEEPMDAIVQILHGISFLHSRHVIHGSLSPSTIFRQSGEFRIGGFDTAQRFEGYAWPGELIGGTPSYLAPEALTGKPCPESDIWSIGVMLYEIVTGSRPFQGDSIEQLVSNIISAPPDAIPHEVNGELAFILVRSLAKQPRYRYAAPEMLEDIQRVRKNVPIRRYYSELDFLRLAPDAPSKTENTDAVSNIVKKLRSRRYTGSS